MTDTVMSCMVGTDALAVGGRSTSSPSPSPPLCSFLSPSLPLALSHARSGLDYWAPILSAWVPSTYDRRELVVISSYDGLVNLGGDLRGNQQTGHPPHVSKVVTLLLRPQSSSPLLH